MNYLATEFAKLLLIILTQLVAFCLANHTRNWVVELWFMVMKSTSLTESDLSQDTVRHTSEEFTDKIIK